MVLICKIFSMSIPKKYVLHLPDLIDLAELPIAKISNKMTLQAVKVVTNSSSILFCASYK